jgi:hypothetical protein
VTFISDGNRTWNPERGIELVRIRGGREFHQFKLESPAGHLFFEAESSAYKIPAKLWRDASQNPAINTIIDWHVLLNDCFPDMDEEQTRELIREAMKSYEWLFGGDSIDGHPPHDVVCRFSGKLA